MTTPQHSDLLHVPVPLGKAGIIMAHLPGVNPTALSPGAIRLRNRSFSHAQMSTGPLGPVVVRLAPNLDHAAHIVTALRFGVVAPPHAVKTVVKIGCRTGWRQHAALPPRDAEVHPTQQGFVSG